MILKLLFEHVCPSLIYDTVQISHFSSTTYSWSQHFILYHMYISTPIFSLIRQLLIIGLQSFSYSLKIFVFGWVVIKRQSVNVPSYHSRLWLISKPHCRELYVMWILIKATVLKLFPHFSLTETYQSFMSKSVGQENIMFAVNMYINNCTWCCITPQQQWERMQKCCVRTKKVCACTKMFGVFWNCSLNTHLDLTFIGLEREKSSNFTLT